ncbi:MAG TPA: MBL fold metallo-hydrolase [Ktedonosporobacter sp.]|nr:MBL fold metallo-hydrolase [Ktedonosporobacter sp.]
MHDHSGEVPGGPARLEQVSDGIYAYIQPDGSWGLNNPAFIVGPEAVVVIDTCFTEARSKALIATIQSITSLPIRTVINTHHHGDHTWGNGFLPQATIIGHDLCRSEMIAVGLSVKMLFPTANFGEVTVVPPTVTFQDRLDVYAGDMKLELHFVGPAHTVSDVVVWVPERKVLFTGDVVFKDCTPFVLQGSITPYFDVLNRLRSFGAEVLVPGHGPVCGPEGFDEVEEYLRFVMEQANRGFEAGLTPLELARQTVLGKYTDWADFERIVANYHRAYSELRGEPLAAPLNIVQILRESMEYGGHELRCYA